MFAKGFAPLIVVVLFLQFSDLVNSDPGNAGVCNEGFDNATPAPWEKTHDATPAGSEMPWSTGGGNPGRCGHLGPIAGGPPNGSQISIILQSFDCDGPGKFCTITFDALYPAGAAGESAEVYLSSGGAPKQVRIPVAAGWQTYVISAPGCDEVSVVGFELFGPATGSTQELRIDNVSSECTPDDDTSEELTVVPDTFCDSVQNCNAPSEPPLENFPGGIPTVSEWGLIVMTVLVLTAGTVAFGRRRRPAAA